MKKAFLVLVATFLTTGSAQAQFNVPIGDRPSAVVSTAVPFLTLTPDSRAGAMGDVGVATSPDVFNNHWNASKIAFTDKSGMGVGYTPWLPGLANDINLTYVSGHYSVDDLSGFGFSMRYFSLGDIQFTDEVGDPMGEHRPYEMAFDGSYARKLSERFGVGVGLRFIYSNLTGGHTTDRGIETNPGRSIAGDLSAYYTNPREIFGYDGSISFGLNISNLGAKVTYTEAIESSFLPANLRMGTTVTTDLDEFNQLNYSFDVNKLLVPTNPVRDENDEIVDGMDPDVPVMQGVVQSFYDAPGGFGETMAEFMPSVGIEYWYNQQFALRGGYFYEHPEKGDRQYLSLGMGLRYNILSLDFAYLIATNRRSQAENPLDGTLRFSIGVLFGDGVFSSPADNG